MEYIRVQNLRSIADSGVVEIKPISLLVGANSSGKSSFLRVFPLLRQSAETRTLSGLLLNEGDVNFGFFNEAIRRDADPPELKLEFGIKLRPGFYQGAPSNRFLTGPLFATCELAYAKRANEPRYPLLCTVTIVLKHSTASDKIEICTEQGGRITKFAINDFNVPAEIIQNLRSLIHRGIVPILTPAINPTDSTEESINLELDPLEEMLLDQTQFFFHGRTTYETRMSIFRSIKLGSPEAMLAEMQSISGISSWKDNAKNWTVTTPTFRKVRNLLLAYLASDLLASINIYMSLWARSVHYFQPVRASVERDYLSRDVPVRSVDPAGLNVAMVLGSLDYRSLTKFREWMRKYFGFEVFPQSVSDGARVALRMKEENSETEFNLADTGFGFSQMLPFLLQVWSLVEGETKRRFLVPPPSPISNLGYILAIEQPELHLHPALQAKLADLFVAMVRVSREQKIPIRFMLETHSPTIIERIGQLVESKEAKAEDIQILLFEKGRDRESRNTATVRTVQYDSEGVLQDWPFGFLAAPPITPAASSGSPVSSETI